MLGAGVIMYSITILIETNWSRGREPGQALPLNLCVINGALLSKLFIIAPHHGDEPHK